MFFIWATMSFRKSSFPSTELSFLVGVVPAAAVVPPVPSTLVVVDIRFLRSGEHVDQRATRQPDRGLGHLLFGGRCIRGRPVVGAPGVAARSALVAEAAAVPAVRGADVEAQQVDSL